MAQVGGDGRQVLTASRWPSPWPTPSRATVTPRSAWPTSRPPSTPRPCATGEDEHYDVISAFIKSIRGSDPDAALYWLALMLESGEDARFIARRLVIFASEDIGLADPMGLVVANAAAQAVEFVGLPEARINLAHATVYLAAAPKSNRSYAALGKALADVQDQPRGEVPLHLRGTGYRGAASLGHGEGYDYPHDDPRGWVDQEYRPARPRGSALLRAIDPRRRASCGRADGRAHESPERRGEPMSGTEVAALVVAVAAGIALTVLIVVVIALLRTVRDLRTTVEALRVESVAVVEDLHETVRSTNAELARIDNVLGAAESVAGTMDSASKLAYLTVGTPVVKGLALATGANQAYRRFRGVRRHSR